MAEGLLLGIALVVVLGRPLAAAPRVYRVDAGASKVHVVVLRQGLLSAFAHNHVLVVKDLAGRIELDPEAPAGASAQFSAPVRSLEVDPPQARTEEGFTKALAESDRADIRKTMLSAGQLGEAQHPRIEATLDAVSGALPALRASLLLRIKGTERALTLPVQVKLNGNELRATGTVSLLQSDFGIEPYRVALGTIAVQDRVRIRFDIVARAGAG